MYLATSLPSGRNDVAIENPTPAENAYYGLLAAIDKLMAAAIVAERERCVKVVRMYLDHATDDCNEHAVDILRMAANAITEPMSSEERMNLPTATLTPQCVDAAFADGKKAERERTLRLLKHWLMDPPPVNVDEALAAARNLKGSIEMGSSGPATEPDNDGETT